MKSDAVKKGIERAPHRALLQALGCPLAEMDKPFIGIVNSFSEIVPGHMHLREIAEAVKTGVYRGGGVPFEVNTIAVCNMLARVPKKRQDEVRKAVHHIFYAACLDDARDEAR